jgi:Coenzyme PQQ synthesis protein D (PqqD)/UPF0506
MQERAQAGLVVPEPNRNVIVQDVFGELLVYDLERNIVRRLNRAAAAIWKQCDGQKNVAEIARAVGPEFEGRVDENVVLLALRRFGRTHLLAGPAPQEKRARKASRREWIKGIGIAAVPLVTSMVVPTAAQAASCLPLGSLCSSNSQCCSGKCILVLGLGLICQP